MPHQPRSLPKKDVLFGREAFSFETRVFRACDEHGEYLDCHPSERRDRRRDPDVRTALGRRQNRYEREMSSGYQAKSPARHGVTAWRNRPLDALNLRQRCVFPHTIGNGSRVGTYGTSWIYHR